jgi:hypothetical protein
MLTEAGRGAAARSSAAIEAVPDAGGALAALVLALEAVDYRGWDPYDALASPFVRSTCLARPLRRAALQAFKRSPLNVRPMFGVPTLQHAKGLALAVSAYARLAAVEPSGPWLERAERLAQRLVDQAIRTHAGAGWGYAFDVELRWGAYGPQQANAVVTSYAAHALLDLVSVGGGSGLEDVAREAVSLAVGELWVEDGSDAYFVYCNGSRVPIHNANVLVASFVARASDVGSPERDFAARAVAYTTEHQRHDGSWPYGEAEGLSWVDGFHTAYVLERLGQWHGLEPDPAVADAIALGLDFFFDHLVDADGAPRAGVGSRYPIESHAAGSAVNALISLRGYDARAEQVAGRVLAWALENLRRPDGRFVFRRGRFLVNRVPYVRWSDAHMLLALANHVSAVSG